MAGLLTARVLADHFERVSVIERDTLEEEAGARKGLPQARHVHGFWARGLDYLESLLPGLRASLIEGGASVGDTTDRIVWHHYGYLKLKNQSGIVTTVMTRPFLEQEVLRRVRALPSITFITGRAVSKLLTDPQRTRVVGVELASAGDEPAHALSADLVVDASGRTGLSSRWLVELGYQAPPESRVRIDLTYVTRYFERSDTPLAARAMGYATLQKPPTGRRAGVCFAVEGKRWQLTLVGIGGEHSPLDHAGFVDYARSLPLPELHEIAAHERPLGDAVMYKFASNLRRHYEHLQRFPAGLLVIGDALTSFNPTYGQGMTVAALEVEALGQLLARARSLDGLAKRFFTRAAKIVDTPWMLTTGEDLRYAGVTGARSWHMPISGAYVAAIHRASAVDATVCKRFFEVAGMQKAPHALFAPNIMLRALLARDAAR